MILRYNKLIHLMSNQNILSNRLIKVKTSLTISLKFPIKFNRFRKDHLDKE